MEKITIAWPELGFEPLFYILDTKCRWVMAVREEDKYAYKGSYIAYQGLVHGFQQWPAFMNKNELLEYSPSYEFTKSKTDAFQWALDHSLFPDNNNVPRKRIKDFPAY
jgi:hypothetical protein